ncbi:uncharacterized protein LOC142330813 isoform X2 [Lycorma delicatula]
MPKKIKFRNHSDNLKTDLQSLFVEHSTLTKKNTYQIKKEEIKKQLRSINNDNLNKSKGNISLRSICHKNSSGCNNWKKFIEMEGSTPERTIKNENKTSNKNVKLPLMKSGLFNENKNKFVDSSVQFYKRPRQQAKTTNVIAMDCEMVGVGENGSISILARVSLVNSFGECIYDKYVKPTETVKDYRTFVSGIRPHHLESGEDFVKVQLEVANLLKGRTLVGHAIKHDLQVLILHHPRKYIRDTTTFIKFRNEAKGTLSLKNLAHEFLNVKIQDGEHDSVEDARAAMQLYMTYRKEWEQERRNKWLTQKTNPAKQPIQLTTMAVDMI